MSKKIKVVAITNDHKVEVKEVRRPDVEPDKMLIHIKVRILCTQEQRAFTWEFKMPLPFVGGHETVGSVAAVGEGVGEREFPVEGKLTARLIQVCGKCYFCRRDEENLCVDVNAPLDREMEIPGTRGFGEYLSINPSQAYLLSESLSDIVAMFNKPLACMPNSIERGQIVLGDDVAVPGGGIMGTLHVLYTKLPDARVTMSEPDTERRVLTKTLGCDDTISLMEINPVDCIKNLNGIGAEAAFNTTPISAITKQAVEMIAPLGRCVMYNPRHPDKPIGVSPNWLHSSETVIIGAVGPSVRFFQRTTSMLGKELIDPERLVPGVYPCNQAQKVSEATVHPGAFRIIITF